MKLTIQPLHPLFAAEIGGVDLANDTDPTTIAGIREAIETFAVVRFRNQTLSNDQQIAFARHFGPVEAAVTSFRKDNKSRITEPGLVDVSNLDENNKPRLLSDRLRMLFLGNRLWHSDSSFRAIPGALSMLYARDVPPERGETEFTDMRAAYDELDVATKAQIQPLFAQHSLMHSRARLGYTDFSPEEYAALPPVPQPLVRTLPWSGRKSLYVGAHAAHIVGWPVPEGRMLLEDLMEHATQRRFVFTQAWQAGDLVIWDNRCTMHRGRAYDEAYPRDLRRVTTSDVAAPAMGAAQ